MSDRTRIEALGGIDEVLLLAEAFKWCMDHNATIKCRDDRSIPGGDEHVLVEIGAWIFPADTLREAVEKAKRQIPS